jgi:hypothetical protein
VALAAAHDGGAVPLSALLLHALPARTFVRQHPSHSTSSAASSIPPTVTPTLAQYLSTLRRTLMERSPPADCPLRLSADGLRVCVGQDLSALSVRNPPTHLSSPIRSRCVLLLLKTRVRVQWFTLLAKSALALIPI